MLAGAGAGYFIGVLNQRASTTTTTTTSTVTSLYYSDLGSLLQLRTTLNATTLKSGGSVMVTIALFNPLRVNLSAILPSSASSTIGAWNDYDFVCSPSYSFAGYALFEGHYSSGNISLAGNPFTLRSPGQPPCPSAPFRGLLLVLPSSTNAVAYEVLSTNPPSYLQHNVTLKINPSTNFCLSQFGTDVCGVSSGLFGYWNATGPSGTRYPDTSKYFHYFSPGQYTLVVEGAWGQVIYEYFEVVSA
jgi:hypothetical protein